MSENRQKMLDATRRVVYHTVITEKQQVLLATSIACLNMYLRGDAPLAYVPYAGAGAGYRRLVENGCYREVRDSSGKCVGVELTEDVGVHYGMLAVAGGYCPPHLAADSRNTVDPLPLLRSAAKASGNLGTASCKAGKPDSNTTKPQGIPAKRCLRNVMSLSTSHVPYADIDDFGDFRFVPTQYGWIVWLYDDATVIPAWLRPIARKASELDCAFIEFDGDADVCEEFDTYEW